MSIFRRRRDDQELDDEIAFHLAQEAKLLADRGIPQEHASHAARRAFGSVAIAKEDARAVRVSVALEQLVQDLRFGFRIFTTSPALSATAVLLIALVIGGNTTVFSMAHGLLSKPAPGVTAPRLMTLSWVDDKGWVEPFNSYAVYEAFRGHDTSLERMVGFDMDRATLAHHKGSYAVNRAFVSSDYFETLGAHFEKGRSFTAQEAGTGTSGLLVIVSHHVWQNLFNGTEDVIGTPVMINNQPATIIGVAALPFRGSLLTPATDLWVPLNTLPTTRTSHGPASHPSSIVVGMIGRLAPGASREGAHAELSAIWARMQSAEPMLNQKLKLTMVPYSANAGGNSLVSQRGGMFLAIFSTVTLMTLLIVCANVANLLVARAVVRQRELSVRQSLGASRLRIFRCLLAEGFALSVAAWIAACLFAWWTSRSVSRFLLPTTQGMSSMPDFTPDWTVLGYALALAIVCTIACTIVPAIRACRQALVPSLKAGEQAVIRGRSKLSSGLVVVQLAFSVVLVTSAGLAYRSMFLMGAFTSGFDTRDLLLVTVNTSASADNPTENGALLERLAEQLRRVRGIAHVTYARSAPRETWNRVPVGVPGSSLDVERVEMTRVGPDYLRLFGAAPFAGRDFISGEAHRPSRSALISQNLAERLWPGQSPLGRALIVDKQEVEVVGVTPNLFYSGFRREHPNFVFLSALQDPFQPGEATLYLRYSGNLDTMGSAITRALQHADAATPIAYMRTWDTQLDSITWPIRVLTMLLMLFAGGSLFIAAIGQYAVVAFDMRRRMRELGLRMALGASSRQLLAKVLREGLSSTALGLVLGFALSLATGRLLGGALYGISATDPLTYGMVFALLTGASLVACYLPARRAAQINPTVALRIE